MDNNIRFEFCDFFNAGSYTCYVPDNLFQENQEITSQIEQTGT